MTLTTHRKHLLSAIAATALACAAAGAQANLVTNGGFETGNLAGWAKSGIVGWDGVTSSIAHTGTYGYFSGALGAPSTISQTLATVAGSTYHIEFWLGNANLGNLFAFNWDGGAAEISFAGGPSSYTLYSLDAVASTNSTSIAFTVRNDPDFTYIDDVSVTATVPEPGSLALVGLAALLAAATRPARRRTA